MKTLEELRDTELQPLYELYMNDCVQKKCRSSLSDFVLWMEEEGYLHDE